MIDREKVVKGLSECVTAGLEKACPTDCPYFLQCFPDVGPADPFVPLMQDALALLKEQETTFEKDGHHITCKSCGAYWCDRDREGDRYPQNFCPNCGKVVKRND